MTAQALTRSGIDYADWRPPSAQWLLSQGYGFVCRYLSWLPNPKVIDRNEYLGLRWAGIDVVLVWEYGAFDMRDGATAGRVQATEAKRQAQALGAWPCPIYFACDFDASQADQPAIDAYLGVCSFVLGSYNLVGMYGGYWPLSRALAGGFCHYGWQTSAWSGGQWLPGAGLRQLPGGNASYDVDQAVALDFGQVQTPVPPGPPLPGDSRGEAAAGQDGWPAAR